MSRILLIETSSKNCSVALGVDGAIARCIEQSAEDYVHAEKLHSFIEQLLFESDTKLEQLDAVAVSKGPGSYTGLRIGVSAAKGLCFGLKIPLIAIDTTQVLAHYARGKYSLKSGFLAMIDARRMEVYCALYDSQVQLLKPVEAKIIDDTFFAGMNAEQTVLVGDGAEKSRDFFSRPENILSTLPSASMMAELAQESFAKSEFEDVAYFEPYYLKDFIAGVQKKNLLL